MQKVNQHGQVLIIEKLRDKFHVSRLTNTGAVALPIDFTREQKNKLVKFHMAAPKRLLWDDWRKFYPKVIK